MKMRTLQPILISCAIVLGLAAHGYFVVRALERFRKEDRFISVKGFSEREVKANFAVWTIKTRITTNDLTAGSKEIETGKEKIITFLMQKGIQRTEIIQQDIGVLDKMAREYGQQDIGAFRYIIENSMQVRSENVETVQKVSRMTDELLQAGVVISNGQDYRPAVQYLFTKLSEIKPAMLSEATRNAHNAATEFARESQVELGSLRKANQGLFTILDRDESLGSPGGEGGYYGSGTSDVYKKVRVVVNVEYGIR